MALTFSFDALDTEAGDQETLQSLHLWYHPSLLTGSGAVVAQKWTSCRSYSLRFWRRCPLGSLATSRGASDEQMRWPGEDTGMGKRRGGEGFEFGCGAQKVPQRPVESHPWTAGAPGRPVPIPWPPSNGCWLLHVTMVSQNRVRPIEGSKLQETGCLPSPTESELACFDTCQAVALTSCQEHGIGSLAIDRALRAFLRRKK